MSLSVIEELTKDYAAARASLKDHVEGLQREIEAVKARKANKLKALINKAAEAEVVLRAMIEDCPECFKKPKTHIFHGVRVGFKKQKGSLIWKSAEHVMRLIRKNFPDQADILIRSRFDPDKEALGKLEVNDLKKIAVKVDDDGDVVLIKQVEGDIEKTAQALIKEAAGAPDQKG